MCHVFAWSRGFQVTEDLLKQEEGGAAAVHIRVQQAVKKRSVHGAMRQVSEKKHGPKRTRGGESMMAS